MSRKHYIAVAKMFAKEMADASSESERAIIKRIAEEMAHAFAQDNSLFNRSKFLEAAGVK